LLGIVGAAVRYYLIHASRVSRYDQVTALVAVLIALVFVVEGSPSSRARSSAFSAEIASVTPCAAQPLARCAGSRGGARRADDDALAVVAR
jgi:hypothetical protein